ncbi:cytochrome c peroxidase [Porticoccus sp. W117]|uniref:cytochrome-c peroxidase n=1 Tax=Porticoccus sp. W117 TaxID=3054777 RepID=UPI002591EC19|nr:cytochrome c peroxidase [Porticoccus sp. W117]MDM3871145.1 cytochrome c peroxidase [Porticoccus sp. W117]
MIKNQFCARAFVVMLAICLTPLTSGLCLAQEADPGAGSEGALYLNYIKPLPQSLPVDREKALLGQALFHDTGLAAGRAACGTCHVLEQWGADGMAKSIDIRGGFDDMNTLTVFNAVFNFRLLWNGAAATPKDQIDMVMDNERHMGAGWSVALQYVRSRQDYQQQFKALYGGVIDEHTVSDAIVEYERTLITPDAPIDHYLRGDNNAISERQKQGLKLFVDYGCIACHQGINVGGNMFARFGVFVKPYQSVVPANEFDLGRFNVTGVESDRYVMRVPSLRNVEKTAPYFHNGGTQSLKKAVTAMGYYQLGRDIPDDEAELIVEFLKSLTGKKPEPVQ